MKTKNAIKMINTISDLFKLAIELEKKQAERLANIPVDDWGKDAVESMLKLINTQKEFEKVCGKELFPERKKYDASFVDGIEFTKAGINLSFSEEIEKSMPFAHPDSEGFKNVSNHENYSLFIDGVSFIITGKKVNPDGTCTIKVIERTRL